jgi:aconitate hydratase
VPFIPGRVLLQDLTGVPVLADLAAMRDAAMKLGMDSSRVNPRVPVDMVIDHSVMADFSGTADARERNEELEYSRNRERYAFIRWGQKAFANFRVVPPSTGICHQVNLEHLSGVVLSRDGRAFPDTVIGTDSHTTTVNGLAVLGWGVGGIEAEAAMLGHPVPMLVPDVVGVRLKGRLPEGSTATDLVLVLTAMLRRLGVVGRFVEYFGEGVAGLSLPDRATVANMAPEYGATTGFFPADERTVEYLRLTGHPDGAVALAEAYLRAQGLFRAPSSPDPDYTRVMELDLATVEPALAGPRRPHDRVALKGMKEGFARALSAPVREGGFAAAPASGTGNLPTARWYSRP